MYTGPPLTALATACTQLASPRFVWNISQSYDNGKMKGERPGHKNTKGVEVHLLEKSAIVSYSCVPRYRIRLEKRKVGSAGK